MSPVQKAEIVIIGGGVVGASVAFHLTQRGCRDVLVLERERALGRGSTGAATGGVRAQFETDINIKLSLYSIDFFRDWGHDCGYDPRGYLFVASDERQLRHLQQCALRQRALGYKEVEILDRDVIREMVPGLQIDDVVGGSLGPRDGFIDPLAVLEGFMSGALTNGARVETGRELVGINVNGGRVTGVDTDEVGIECGAVVLCAGAWSRDIATTAGIDVPVQPLRRQIVYAHASERPEVRLAMVVDVASGFHFREVCSSAAATGSDWLLAYSDPEERPGFNCEFDDAFIGKVFDRVRHRAPFLAEAEVIRKNCRAGLYEMTPDHHAILGGCEVDGMFLACGFSGHGVMHSPATGRALAEIILDGHAHSLDVSPLDIGRFAKGKVLRETALI